MCRNIHISNLGFVRVHGASHTFGFKIYKLKDQEYGHGYPFGQVFLDKLLSSKATKALPERSTRSKKKGLL